LLLSYKNKGGYLAETQKCRRGLEPINRNAGLEKIIIWLGGLEFWI